jgi:hypothetical protein
MRIEVFITITVGVLVISSINVIKVNAVLLLILLTAYFVFGYINFSMTMAEMNILLAGIAQIQSMIDSGADVSYMGKIVAAEAAKPSGRFMIPAMHISYWCVTASTMAYAIWRYRRSS